MEERGERREETAFVGAVSCELLRFVYFTNVARSDRKGEVDLWGREERGLVYFACLVRAN